jgi:hypothetical protein
VAVLILLLLRVYVVGVELRV